MTYAEAVARLLALRGGEHAGMRPGLERIETLLDALGHPEQRFTLVQIGGTNGKGSASAVLANVLKAAGRRVGLYTSPHLVSFRERIRVDGEAISEEMLATLYQARTVLFGEQDKEQQPKEEEQALAETDKSPQQGTGEPKPDEPRRQDA
jgi:dihydrofolate synthase/folylpolyglutamate synthase